MYKDLVLINKENNKDNSVKEVKDYLFAKNLMSVPITFSEFYEACKNYAIFFSKDEKDQWFATALLGYKQNENVYVNKKGEGDKLHYVPAFVRKYPFVIIQENKQQALAIEKDYLEENKDRKLFDDKQENSEFLNSVLSFLGKFETEYKSTQDFIQQLDEWGILEEKTATIVKDEKEKYNINKLFVVNEEKLNHLSKKKKEDMYSKNVIPLITAHLISLTNVQKLGLK